MLAGTYLRVLLPVVRELVPPERVLLELSPLRVLVPLVFVERLLLEPLRVLVLSPLLVAACVRLVVVVPDVRTRVVVVVLLLVRLPVELPERCVPAGSAFCVLVVREPLCCCVVPDVREGVVVCCVVLDVREPVVCCCVVVVVREVCAPLLRVFVVFVVRVEVVVRDAPDCSTACCS